VANRNERQISVRVKAPAKVNLSLEVLGLRPDGYHEIGTVMQAISLFDEMEFASADDGRIVLTSSHPGLPVDERNLVTRAAQLLQRRYDVRQGTAISLLKRIPLGGGLGGGSSDSAIALLALSELWGLDVRMGELAEMAAELGSDLPFFLWGGTALCEGRGERVTAIKCPRTMDYVLVLPSCFVSTAEVYAAAKSGLTPFGDGRKNVIRALEGGDVKLLGASLRNDLQEAALGLHDELQRIWSSLEEHRKVCNAKGLLLSGSGSSFFLLMQGEREAIRASNYLMSRLGVPCAVVHGVAAWGGRLSRLTLGRGHP
jgi:4-diphosphocytidyl-2-C-methyl-D-erythritol kinase